MNSRVVWFANVRVGVDALRIHPLRTMLSVLGIIIGAGSLVATMAVSDGMMRFARGQIERETSVQVISIGSRTNNYDRGQWIPVSNYPVFTLNDAIDAQREISEAASVTIMLSGSAIAKYRGVEQRSQATLGTAELTEFGPIELAAGRFFSPIEELHNTPVVVLNFSLARELAPGHDPLSLVGETIQVRGRARRVIGVLTPNPYEEPRNPEFGFYAPIRSAEAILDPPSSGKFTPTLQLKAANVETVTALRDAAMDWLARRYVRWEDRVRVSVGLERLAQVEKAFFLAKLFFGALVGISLLVGGIGIMNVLLASVAERTREIGIRKAVGARSADIRTQFLAESVAIAAVGTGIGLGAGLLIALVVMAAIRFIAEVPVSPVLSVNTVLLAIVSSSLVGLAFGTYPARRAARLPPIEAIAHE